MTTNQWVILGGAAVFFFVARHIIRRYQEVAELRAALTLASMAADTAKEAAEKLGALATLHERRASEFFSIIAGVEKERDGWQKFYNDSTHAAGAAQAWLARDLNRVLGVSTLMADKLRELGVTAPTLKVDPGLSAILDHFADAHGEGKATLPRAPGMEAAEKVDGTPLVT